MKIKNIQKLFFAVAGIAMLASCKKDTENIFNMFDDVTVTYNAVGPYAVTDYKLVNDGDSVHLNYTINSANTDMYSIVVERSGGTSSNTGIDRPLVITLTEQTKTKSYSGIYKFKSSRDGKTSYRVFGLDRAGVYVGDGYKKITIEQNPSYLFFTNRDVYLPDTAGKVLPSFFSLTDGSQYSYTNGAANADKIDFGVYRRPTTATGTIPAGQEYAYNLYALNTTPNPLTVYDISAWTPKRATKFAAPQASQNTAFIYNAISSSTIDAIARARNPNLAATTATTYSAGLIPNSTVAFLTPEGKYGIIMIQAIANDYSGRPYIRMHAKIQK